MHASTQSDMDASRQTQGPGLSLAAPKPEGSGLSFAAPEPEGSGLSCFRAWMSPRAITPIADAGEGLTPIVSDPGSGLRLESRPMPRLRSAPPARSEERPDPYRDH